MVTGIHPEKTETKTEPGTLRHQYAGVVEPVPVLEAQTQNVVDESRHLEREPSGPWAIIVNHGMGQQVHSETLESIALAIRNTQIKHFKQAHKDAPADRLMTQVVKLKTIDGKCIEMVRAEMIVRDSKQRAHEVHIYESYWAPLTQGKVTLIEVFQFLGNATVKGFAFLCRHFWQFKRWSFGQMHKYPVRVWLTGIKLIFALLLLVPILVVSALMISQVGMFLLAALRDVVQHSQVQPDFGALLVSFATPYVIMFEECLVAFGIGTIVLPKLYRSKMLNAEAWTFRAMRFIVKITAILISLGALWYLFRAEYQFAIRIKDAYNAKTFPQDDPIRAGCLVAVWVAAAAIAYVSRWFLIEFMGDVAVYVSGNKLSKFDELRDAIKQSVMDVMGAVYSAKNSTGALEYEKIAVVGHSLGSVISYDLLNQLLLEDELSQRKDGTGGGVFRNIRYRTKLLLTFGSPLDKVAYLFRIKKNTDELREAAFAASQPLIRSYATRPDRWVNIYSWMDLFSGHLHYYDHPCESEGDTQRVVNVIDKEAWVPLVAHTEYWTNDILGKQLYETITKNP